MYAHLHFKHANTLPITNILPIIHTFYNGRKKIFFFNRKNPNAERSYLTIAMPFLISAPRTASTSLRTEPEARQAQVYEFWRDSGEPERE